MTNKTTLNSSRSSVPERGIECLTFGLARSRSDLCQAFRLVFQSYLKAGLAVEKPSGLRLTPYHMLPTSEVLLAKLDDTVTSTLSMFGDDCLGLPMQSMYSQEIGELRKQGLKLAEIGCLADRRHGPVRIMETFCHLGRLLVQVGHARGIDAFVVATHPKHARLYKRIMGFRQIGDQSDCPYANGNPAVALILKFDDHINTPLYDQYFGDPIPVRELAPYDWESETKEFFQKVLDRDNKIAALAGIHGYPTWDTTTGQSIS